jgi:hypothetical protein
MIDATPNRAARLSFAGAVVALAALALVLFRPWIQRPFDTLDFSEFLPLLTGERSVWARTAALVHYYADQHARFNVASYAALAAKWSILGASPVLWQWTRVGEMGLVVSGAYLLFRRLALRPLPALAGASLFVISRLSSEAWFRMTMGEPLGLLLALGALLLATTWRDRPAELWRGIVTGLLMALAILAKEMLIGLLPLVWVVGAMRESDGRLGPPDRDPRFRPFLLWSALPALAAFGVAGLIALRGTGDGFTELYGRAHPDLSRFLDLFLHPWIIQGVGTTRATLMLPGNLLFDLTLVVGLWAAARRAEAQAHLTWTLRAAAITSACFAALYLPWPSDYLYYAIPFLLAPALLFGMAVQGLTELPPWGPRAALAAPLLLAVLVAPGTGEATSSTIAMQQVNGDVVRTIAMVPNADRLVVARLSPAPQAWMGAAATLRRYAMATGAPATFPVATQDLGCAASGALIQHRLGRTVFVTYLGNCGGLAGPSAHVVRTYRALDVGWSGARWVSESVVADLLVDRVAMMPPVPPAPVR